MPDSKIIATECLLRALSPEQARQSPGGPALRSSAKGGFLEHGANGRAG